MTEIKKIGIPVKSDKKGNRWLCLNVLGNTGLLKAVAISKPVQVLDDDTHHCNQVSVKTSIRYHPKKFKIL